MTNHKILIVEDNPMNLELATDLLELAHFEVSQATTGAAGVALAKQEQPALILMDLDLPDMTGLEATSQLKAEPSTRNIPVVALTAYVMTGDREKALAVGCIGYLTKPIDTRSFTREIGKFFNTHEALE